MSEVRNPDPDSERAMIAAIDAAKAAGDTLGGAFVVRISGVPAGVGSNRQPDTRLDGVLAGALMGMQTVKAVEVGAGRDMAATPGSAAHDTFAIGDGAVVRASNRAGGIEGGISNGQDIVVRITVKPIPTLMQRAAERRSPRRDRSAGDDRSKRRLRRPRGVARRRGDGPARADGAGLEKFGGDSIAETRDNLERAVAAATRLFDIPSASTTAPE